MPFKKVPDKALASAIIQAVKNLTGLSEEELRSRMDYFQENEHFHDGGLSPEIAWNDVQAVRKRNEYDKNNQPPLLKVPSMATAGYNKHYHSSEFDGGTIPGVNGIHHHLDNLNGGGFAYAVYYPSCGAPAAEWEGGGNG